jgi:hypothetical protein
LPRALERVKGLLPVEGRLNSRTGLPTVSRLLYASSEQRFVTLSVNTFFIVAASAILGT